MTQVGQQGTAVAVVLATEVLVEVVEVAAVVIAVAVAFVAVAAVATAAKAEELSVRSVEPFDCKIKKKTHIHKLNRTTLIFGITTCSLFKRFSRILGIQGLSKSKFVFRGQQNNSFTAYTVYHIILMNNKLMKMHLYHSNLDTA